MRKISLFTIIATVLILVFAIVNADARTTRITVKPVETKDVSIEGTFQKLIVDYEDSHEEIYFIENEKEKIRVFPKDEHLYLLGQNVKVTGQDKDGGISANSISQSRNLRQTNVREFEANLDLINSRSTIGKQKILIVLVNPSNEIFRPILSDEAYQKFFDESNPNSVNSYIRETSFNKAYLEGKAIGWYTLPFTKEQICNFQNRSYLKIEQNVINLIQNDINLKEYPRIILIFSQSCGGTQGVSYIYPQKYTTSQGEVYITFSQVFTVENIEKGTASHELGHSFGLEHSNYINCGQDYIKNPLECVVTTYGDNFDTMGASRRKAQYNIQNKLYLKWIDKEQVLNNPGEGTYTITPIETRFGVKGIKIPSAYGFSYFIEYRRPIGFDNYTIQSTGQDSFDGALIRIDWDRSPNFRKKTNETFILDFTPNDGNRNNVVLKKDQTFTDNLSGFSITVNEFTEEFLNVNIERF